MQRKMKLDKAAGAAIARQEFRASRLHGGYAAEHRTGRLPEQYHEAFLTAVADPFTYVIWSGSTPIAWRTFLDGWVVPEGVPRVARSHRRVVEQIVAWETENALDPYALVG